MADYNFSSASVAQCSVTVFDGFVPDTEGKNISSGREVQLYRTGGPYGEHIFGETEGPDTILHNPGLRDKEPDTRHLIDNISLRMEVSDIGPDARYLIGNGPDARYLIGNGPDARYMIGNGPDAR